MTDPNHGALVPLRETEKAPTARSCADGQTSGAVGTEPQQRLATVRPSAPNGRWHRIKAAEGHRRHLKNRRHRRNDADGHPRHIINRRYRPVARGPPLNTVDGRYGTSSVPTALPSAKGFFVPLFFITEMTITHLINPNFFIYFFLTNF